MILEEDQGLSAFLGGGKDFSFGYAEFRALVRQVRKKTEMCGSGA